MKKLMLAAAAAALLGTASLGTMPAAARDVGVRIGPDGFSVGTRDRYRERRIVRERYDDDDDCRTVTIRERDRFGNRVTRRVEQC